MEPIIEATGVKIDSSKRRYWLSRGLELQVPNRMVRVNEPYLNKVLENLGLYDLLAFNMVMLYKQMCDDPSIPGIGQQFAELMDQLEAIMTDSVGPQLAGAVSSRDN